MEKTKKGSFLLKEEVETLRYKFIEDYDLCRLFSHIDALEELIQEQSENYEAAIIENDEAWIALGNHFYEAEKEIDDLADHATAMQDRIHELDRLKAIGRADANLMANEVIRLMRKVPSSTN
jgi:septation ring formation regulator EzrA